MVRLEPSSNANVKVVITLEIADFFEDTPCPDGRQASHPRVNSHDEVPVNGDDRVPVNGYDRVPVIGHDELPVIGYDGVPVNATGLPLPLPISIS